MKEVNASPSRALPCNTLLNDTYVVQEVLGEGGFGITYSGYHKNTSEHVAIKEYFPAGIACRSMDKEHPCLEPFHGKSAQEFDKGRLRFLNEAKVLKELPPLDSIVSVYDYFEEGNTAYIVMEYIEGLTLDQYIHENGTLPFEELLTLMTPVIQSLIQIHNKGLIHCDISPDNLLVGLDNQLHLIDFGAASKENFGKRKKHTVILKSGYAPPEQYVTDGKMGAWIDVYALCATMYFALTGAAPEPAIYRMHQDTLKPLSMLTDINPWQSAAIERGLQIHPSERFRDMDELFHALTTPSAIEKNPTVTGSKLTPAVKWQIRFMNKSVLSWKLLSALAVAALCLITFWKLQISSGALPHQTADTLPKVTAMATKTNHPASRLEAGTVSPEQTKEPELLSMIDVTGYSLKEARKSLKKLDADIEVTTTYSYSKKVPSGHIISQSVAKKTLFTAGRIPSIRLSVSKGAKPVSVQPTKTPVSPKDAPTDTKKPTASPSTKDKFQIESDDTDYTTIHRN